MPANRTRGAALRRLVCVCSIAASLALPAAALAQEAPSLSAGEAAWVANAGGENVLLRASGSFDAPVVAAYPEGTPLTVGGAPATATDGSLWYPVSIGPASGYMLAAYLSPTWTAAPAAGTLESAQPAPATDAAPAASAPASAAPASGSAGSAQTTAATELRASPSTDGATLAAIPAGATLTPTGEANDGFLGATYAGQTGWVDAAFVTIGEEPAPPADASVAMAQPAPAATTAPAPAAAPAASAAPLVGDPNAAPAGTSATATAVVNLRSGPGYDQPVLRVLPIGSSVVVTGDPSGGFDPVWYNGTTGWIDQQYLATGAPADGSAAFAQQAPATTANATTTDNVVLRADPSVTAPAVASIPGGTSLQSTGDPVSGFYPVAFGDASGWVSGAFLTFDGPRPGSESADQPAASKTATPATPAATPAASSSGDNVASGLIWPVSGGDWYVLQGYDGSSHQDESALWQYEYSLDLARKDGQTAGQQVISPATGTIRWFDPSTGGISIDIGNDHAVALFHVTVDPSLKVGQSLAQGSPIGTISGPGGPGYMGVAHVHLALWETSDGGNWDRHAEPFVAPYTLDGQSFPDNGGSYQYTNYEFHP